MIRRLLERYASRRPPDFNIGPGYLLRWWLVPRNRWLNVYLHQFRRSDDDRALHDHPWASCSIILSGLYLEHLPGGIRKWRRAGHVVFRRATQAHRIELPVVDGGITYTWTLFITGPKVREWGFHCPQGWIGWRRFTNPTDSARTGRGCD